MRLRHPDLDVEIEAPDDPHTIAVHKAHGWVPDLPPEHGSDLAATVERIRRLITDAHRLDDPVLLDDADRLIIQAVHHGAVRPWEMFAAAGSDHPAHRAGEEPPLDQADDEPAKTGTKE